MRRIRQWLHWVSHGRLCSNWWSIDHLVLNLRSDLTFTSDLRSVPGSYHDVALGRTKDSSDDATCAAAITPEVREQQEQEEQKVFVLRALVGNLKLVGSPVGGWKNYNPHYLVLCSGCRLKHVVAILFIA